jgi:hypothetical protein
MIKITEMEKSKDKLMLYGAIGAAFIAGAGWTGVDGQAGTAGRFCR